MCARLKPTGWPRSSAERYDGLDDGSLIVQAPPEQVGEVAAANGVVLHELTTERATLEEVFLELTGDPGERGV